jgi:polysaccharide biosynthesis protein PslF
MTSRFGLLSTYPPTQCGLATFTASLATELRMTDDAGGGVGVAQIVDRAGQLPVGVDLQLVRGSPASALETAAWLNGFDVAMVQHEFGIYGGRDGDELIAMMAELTVPVIVVLHTVPAEPTSHQREVLEAVVDRATVVVTMSRAARRRLLVGYMVAPTKVNVIPHGAPVGLSGVLATGSREPPPSRPTILTWGLIGPGKGIEWGIEAMAELAAMHPAPRYRIVGQTHPKVSEREGEAYRNSLIALAEARGVADLVEFVAAYLDAESLQEEIRGADLVLLPYESREQVTSGALVEALAAGRPVVATAFPHAVELLASGAGLLVAHQDPIGIAKAIRRVITEPGLALSMGAEATRVSLGSQWPTVAICYRQLAATLMAYQASAMA